MLSYQTPAGSPESTKLVTSSKGKLDSLVVTNVSGGTRYLYVFDNTAASGTLACPPVLLLSGGSVTVENISYATGIYVASSSTITPYTAAGGTDFILNAQGNEL